MAQDAPTDEALPPPYVFLPTLIEAGRCSEVTRWPSVEYKLMFEYTALDSAAYEAQLAQSELSKGRCRVLLQYRPAHRFLLYLFEHQPAIAARLSSECWLKPVQWQADRLSRIAIMATYYLPEENAPIDDSARARFVRATLDVAAANTWIDPTDWPLEWRDARQVPNMNAWTPKVPADVNARHWLSDHCLQYRNLAYYPEEVRASRPQQSVPVLADGLGSLPRWPVEQAEDSYNGFSRPDEHTDSPVARDERLAAQAVAQERDQARALLGLSSSNLAAQEVVFDDAVPPDEAMLDANGPELEHGEIQPAPLIQPAAAAHLQQASAVPAQSAIPAAQATTPAVAAQAPVARIPAVPQSAPPRGGAPASVQPQFVAGSLPSADSNSFKQKHLKLLDEFEMDPAVLAEWAQGDGLLNLPSPYHTGLNGWTVEERQLLKEKYTFEVSHPPDGVVQKGSNHRVRIPNPPTFDGEVKSPRDVKAWIRSMSLAIRQLNPPDPVMYALNFLRGNAAIWGEADLETKFPGLSNIPWASFTQLLMSRFVPASIQMESVKALERMSMTGTVDEYNARFKLALDEVEGLEHAHVPDQNRCMQIYVRGLTKPVKKLIGTRVNLEHIRSLANVQALASECEHLHKQLQSGHVNLFGDIMASLNTDNAQDKKRKRDDAEEGYRHPRNGQDSYRRGRGNRGGGARGGYNNHGHGGYGDSGSREGARQFPADAPLSTEMAPERFVRCKANAKYHAVKGSDNKSYPNWDWRALYFPYNRDNKLCTYCGNKYDFDSPARHGWQDCLSPLKQEAALRENKRQAHDFAQAHMLASANVVMSPVHAHQNALETATPDIAEERLGTASVPTVLCASVSAQPFQQRTLMLHGVVGAVDEAEAVDATDPAQVEDTPTMETDATDADTAVAHRQPARILLDTGSDHSFVHPDHCVGAKQTGRSFNVNLAKKGTFLLDIPEVLVRLKIADYECEWPALKMPLPVGIDAILGMDWMEANNADLLLSHGQVCFTAKDTNVPHIIEIPKSLEHDSFNANFMFTSAARCNDGAEAYLMLIRTQQPDGHCAATFAAVDDTSVDGTTADADTIHVEQHGVAADIKQLVKEYEAIFAEQVPDGLPPKRKVAHAIPLQPGAKPVTQRARRLSYAEEQEMVRQVQDLLKKGWIDTSSSPWGSPILFVKKKGGGMRMCVDYRAVNKMTIKNSYPLPRIDDMLDKLAGASMFTCLDLQQAYHQVRLEEEDVPKTAFTTPIGLFEYKVLPFGLSNAPSTFQSLMNSVLGTELRHCCLVYLDDIIVFSKDPAEHVHHLRAVLDRLRAHKLYARLSKCKFGLTQVKFLGHVVSSKGIEPDADKIRIVRDWPTPTSIKECRSFVGLAQYFRKFVMGFPAMLAPLTDMFKNDAVFRWTDACQTAFDQVKQALTSAPCLKLPDNQAEFTVVCDASGYGIGAVLLQEQRPVAFEGRKMTDVERKWGAGEQEMLSAVHHLQKWRCYLEGRHFRVITDHQPNTWFASQPVLSPRLARWYEKIRSYDFDWEYKPGRINVADPLSRNPAFLAVMLAVVTRSRGFTKSTPAPPPSKQNREVRSMLKHADGMWGPQPPTSIEPDNLQHVQGSDSVEMPAVVGTQNGSRIAGPTHTPLIAKEVAQPNSVSVEDACPAEEVLVPPMNPHLNLNLDDLSRRETVRFDADAIPNTPFNTSAQAVLRQISDAYSGDAYFAPGNSAAWGRSGITYEEDQALTSQHAGVSPSQSGPAFLFMRGNAVVVPDVPELRRAIIRELHCSPYAGHFGVERTAKLIGRYFFWPYMHDEIAKYVRGCELCQRCKSASGKPIGEIMPLPVPHRTWEDISMDFVGPLPKTSRGHDFILVVVDRLSKMGHFVPCKSDITGPQLAELYVSNIFRLHGLPKSIVTDRGTQFLNEWNAALMKLVGTKHCVTSSYHPQSDGQTERTNRVLCEMLRQYVNARYDNWDELLPVVEFAHNNAYSTVTGSTPFYICNGYHPRTPMQEVIDLARKQWKDDWKKCSAKFPSVNAFVADRQKIVQLAQAGMESARQRMIAQENPKRKKLTFEKGDQVSLKTSHLGISTLPSKKLFWKYMGPFTVQKKVNEVAYMLELPKTWKAHNVFHVSLLKPFVSNGDDVEPMSFTLQGGKSAELELERIYDFGPKTKTAKGGDRKVKDLHFFVKWRGVKQGIDAKQPYKNLKGTAEDAMKDLALRWRLPEDQFSKPSNVLSDKWYTPDECLPPPPPRG